ncbi:MAG: hypothetical protein SFX73_13255 [Kofleriaceae bacterium]|nr:hypothetical protein [Kofleriaceae bacterium]
MLRSVALAFVLGSLLAPRAARADEDQRTKFGLGKPMTTPASPPPSSTDKSNPRDLFGLGQKPDTEEPVSCDEPHQFGCATVTDPLDDTSPYGLSTWLTGSYLLSLPLGYVTQNQVANYGLGAIRDDTGISIGGATGLENRWTIDGAPVDNVRTGTDDTRIPLTFLEGMTVYVGGFTAHDRVSTGGIIDAQLVKGGTEHELNAQVWGGLTGNPQRRPAASGSYFVRRLSIEAPWNTALSVVGTGPLGELAGGTAWYAAGLAPELTAIDATWRTSRLVDVNGDGTPDGLPGTLSTQALTSPEQRTYDWFVPAMVRAGYDRGAHHIDLTLLGQATLFTRYLANATVQAAGIDRHDFVVDGIATWRGRWTDTRAFVQLAWHRNQRDESAHVDGAEDIPQLLSAYVPMLLSEDPQLAELCHDGTFPNIAQCPVPFGYFASGGVGVLSDSTGDRPTMTGELTRRIGNHVVRAGGTMEDTRLVLTSRLSGGEQLRSLFDGHLDRLRYVNGDCIEEVGAPCAYANESKLRYRTRYAAAYLEDTFSPTEDIRVDGGLRWELMWVGERLHFSDEFSPRLGISWDFLGEGRSRAWASMGRAYPMLPAGLGSTVIRRDATVHDVETPLGESRDTDAGAAYRVAAGIEPMAQDELTMGVEVGLAKTFRLIAWMQGRWLRRGLETTPSGFDNPGRIEGGPARRTTEQLAVEIATSPTAKLVLRIGYLAGRTVGNFNGAWDPRQGIILYNGDEFGTGYTANTEYGRLPNDVGQRLYAEGSRRFTFGSVDVQAALRLSLASGRPRSAIAVTDVGPLHIIERGSVGRGEMLATTNARVAASWRGFDLALDVLNVFDRGAASSVDEVYTSSFVRPIDGGRYEDVPFLKTTDGAPPGRRTAYGLPLAFQAPISAVLSLHRQF